MEVAFPDWKYKTVVDISRDMVGRGHTKLGEKLGHAQANLVFRFLRSLFNFIAGNYENSKGGPLVSDNPVKRITETKSWYRVDRRRTVIKNSELPAWYQGVLGLKSEIGRDFLLFVLFTGTRKSEAQRVELEHIDLNERTFIFPDTKNRVSLVLPIPRQLHKMLKDRIAKLLDSKYLFPSRGKHEYLAEPKKSEERVIELSGVEFCLHDLRRLFINVAEGLDLRLTLSRNWSITVSNQAT